MFALFLAKNYSYCWPSIKIYMSIQAIEIGLFVLYNIKKPYFLAVPIDLYRHIEQGSS